MVKKIISTLYILVLIFMAVATIVEKSQGTDYVHAHYYGAWWFILIWAALAALGVFYILKRKVRTASTLALHLSFVIILFMVNLTLGFIALFYTIYRMTKKRELQALSRVFLYPALAFLSIVMTYFGVNNFLTGMHSYT